MRFEDLSPQDQHLLQTDLGDFDKVAADQVALIDEMYSTGFDKLATETADWLDKLAEEEEEDKEEENEMDHEGEKTASVFGAWTERGFFDGLRKLGSERYGDETHYLAPFVHEKIGGWFGKNEEPSWARKKYEGAKDWAKGYGEETAKQWRGMTGQGKTLSQRAGHAGKLGLRVGGPLAATGALVYGGKKLHDRRKKRKEAEKKSEKRASDVSTQHKSYSFFGPKRERMSERDQVRQRLMDEIAQREVRDQMQIPSRPYSRIVGGLAGLAPGAAAAGTLAGLANGGLKTRIGSAIAGGAAGAYGGQALGKFIGDRMAKRNRLTADEKKKLLKNM